MVMIQSLYFGPLEVDESELIVFPFGLPGFEELRRFALLQPEADLPFYYLQSAEQGEINFVVADPFRFYPDYEFDLPESVLEEIEIRHEREIRIVSIVTLKKTIQDSTINLLAPVVINMSKKLGKQVVLHQTSYRVREPLFPAGMTKAKE